MSRFLIVSIKHTTRRDPYIAFWRPDNCGYAWPLSWAGRYPEKLVRADLRYYNGGDNDIAVPEEVVEALATPVAPGVIEGNAGPVVANTRENWQQLLAAVIAPPLHHPRPQWQPRRRTSQETP